MRTVSQFFLAALVVSAPAVFAHDAPVDEIGCHEEEITGAYHCHNGPLAGRHFVSRLEAEDALAAMQAAQSEDEQVERRIVDEHSLKILSWNLSGVGISRFEYDRIAMVLGETDLAVLREVEFNKTGETALTVIAGLMRRKLEERICLAWFRSAKGERARHAFLWKGEKVGVVDSEGEMRDECPEQPVVLRVEKIDARQAHEATFYSKSKRRMFLVNSVFWEKKPKSPASEVKSLFSKVDGKSLPKLVATELGVSGKAFEEAKKRGFKAYDGFWSKGLEVVRSSVLDLSARFPEMSASEIKKSLPRSPVVIEISFDPEAANQMKTELIKKSKD